MSRLSRTIGLWFPYAFITTMLLGTVYVAVQQNYRQSANDPQIQMAEDGASALALGASPSTVVGSTTVSIDTSLAPYTIIFDQEGSVVAASGVLGGQTPLPPPGVFDNARAHGENRFTWEPTPGVRSAVVIRPVGTNDGYILAGRSLREVEVREKILGHMILVVWIVSLCILLVYCALRAKRRVRSTVEIAN